MSHGPSGEGAASEPNLTPLLDVVLQLLMFFMMCVNFVNEQVNEDVQLPTSAAARPMDKTDPEALFVNLKPFHKQDFQDRLPSDVFDRVQEKFQDGDECILVLGKEPMRRQDLYVWLKQQYEDAKLAAEKRGSKEVTLPVIIRAHQDADYGQVFEIMDLCKKVGFHRLALRAMSAPGGST